MPLTPRADPRSDESTSPLKDAAARPNRLPQIQGLRALAVVLVVLYHVGLPIPGGFVGVDVFFVISGFVITRLLVTELHTSGRIRFGNFYRRRVRRLLPALTLMISVVLVVSILIESPIEAQTNTAITGAGATLWLANVAVLFVTGGYWADTHVAMLLNTWSLAVEEQFYLVFPGVIGVGFGLARRRRSEGRRAGERRAERGRALAGLGPAGLLVAVVLVVSLAIELWLSFGPIASRLPMSRPVAFFAPMSRAWEFAAGALLAIVLDRRSFLSRPLSEVLAWTGLVMVIGSGLLLNGSMIFPGYLALIPVVGTVLMLIGIQLPMSTVARAMSTPVAQRLGDLSYAWYLWHWPFIALSVTLWGPSVPHQVVMVLVSLGVAMASFRWVEQPLRVGGVGIVKLMGVCLVVPLLLASALYVGAARTWGDPAIADLADQVRPKNLKISECQLLVPLPDRDLGPCTFSGSSSKPPLVLLGDSNAGQYADGLVAAGRELDQTVILATAPGCPVIPLELTRGPDVVDCSEVVRGAIDWLRRQEPSVVVVSSAATAVDTDEIELRDPATGWRADNTSEKAQLWESGLADVFRQLSAQGHTVLQVRAIPHFLDSQGQVWSPSGCTMLTLKFHFDECGESMSLAQGNEMHERGLEAELRAAESAGVEELDLRDQICPDRQCRTNLDRFWVYREGMHLSVGMSRRLAPAFERAVKALDRS